MKTERGSKARVDAEIMNTYTYKHEEYKLFRVYIGRT